LAWVGELKLLKEGDKVKIYEDPLSEKEFEGIAILREKISEDTETETWHVQFLEDTLMGSKKSIYRRRIKKPIEQKPEKRFILIRGTVQSNPTEETTTEKGETIIHMNATIKAEPLGTFMFLIDTEKNINLDVGYVDNKKRTKELMIITATLNKYIAQIDGPIAETKKSISKLECPKCESRNLTVENVVINPRVTCDKCHARYAITLTDLDTGKTDSEIVQDNLAKKA